MQEYSVEYGQADSRFVDPKFTNQSALTWAPGLSWTTSAGILSTRCIRFTRDIAGDDALGIVNRGSYSTLAAYQARRSTNNYSLNTVDIARGRAHFKDFRFKMRVWFLKETKSLCTSCGTGANIIIGSRDDRIYRYEPRQNDAVNSTWMCDYGRLKVQMDQPSRTADSCAQSPPGRLAPVAAFRGDGETGVARLSNWAAAIRDVSELLKKAEADRWRLLLRAPDERRVVFAQHLGQGVGALTDSIPRMGEGDHLLLNADRNPNSVGARLMGISGSPPGSRLKKIAEGIQRGAIAPWSCSAKTSRSTEFQPNSGANWRRLW